jgi:hypothetical protein
MICKDESKSETLIIYRVTHKNQCLTTDKTKEARVVKNDSNYLEGSQNKRLCSSKWLYSGFSVFLGHRIPLD